jgi:hypothetical protein
MKKGKDSRPLYELWIAENQVETVTAHGNDVLIEGFGLDVRGDIDVCTQPGASPDDRSLSAEEIPPQRSFLHRGGECPQDVSDGAAARHDEGSPRL